MKLFKQKKFRAKIATGTYESVSRWKWYTEFIYGRENVEWVEEEE